MPFILTQDQRDDRMTTCGDVISSADDDPTFLNWIDHNWRRNMVFPVLSATESTIRHLESASIATTEKKNTTRQVKKQGDARTVFRFKWNCSRGIHPRRCNCKQNRLHGVPWYLRDSIRVSILNFGVGRIGSCYTTTTPHIALSLSKGTCKATGHRFATPSVLTKSRTMRFLSFSPHESTPTWA